MRSLSLLRRIGRYMTFGALVTLITAAVCAWLDDDAGIGRAPGAVGLRNGERLTDRTGAEVIPAHYGESPPGTFMLRFSAADRRGVTLTIGDVYRYSGFTPAGDPPPKPPTPEAVAFYWERRLALPWLSGDRPWPADDEGSSVWLKAAGWPWRAVCCQLVATNAPNNISHTWSAKGAFIVGNATFGGWADWPPALPRVIPYRPIWPGLLANTAFFAFIAALLPLVPRWARAYRRRRASLCVGCGYDLRGTPAGGRCPECGAAAGHVAAPFK